MDYKIKIDKAQLAESDFTTLPNHAFDLKNKITFFLYAWLVHHRNDLKMNEYFIKKGTGMDYRTFRNYLKILESSGKIKLSTDTNSTDTNSTDTNSTDTNSTDTNSMCTTIEIVQILINKKNKQEERKQEERKQEERKQEERKQEEKQKEVPSTGVPPAQGTAIGVVNEFDEI